MCFHPEGTVGSVDISPGDDDGVFDGLGGKVDTEEGSISVIRHLDVEGQTLGVLKQQRRSNICGSTEERAGRGPMHRRSHRTQDRCVFGLTADVLLSPEHAASALLRQLHRCQ